MRQLEEFARGWTRSATGCSRSGDDPLRKDERANLRRELRDLMLLTQESPRSLRKRCETFRTPVRGLRTGQAAAVQRQSAAGRLDRQEVPQSRPELPGPDPGRQHRPDAGGRQVRVSPRFQVLDLRHLVDSPGDHAGHRRPGPDDSHSGPHDRRAVETAEYSEEALAGIPPRADN